MAIFPEATRLWSFCFWLFCSSQDPKRLHESDADPTWMKGVDWRHGDTQDGWIRSAGAGSRLLERCPASPGLGGSGGSGSGSGGVGVGAGDVCVGV